MSAKNGWDDSAERARTCVVIVTYNSRDIISDAIDPLVESSSIVVLDNASHDGTADHVSARYGDRVHLIRSSENLGFARAVNHAASHARGEFLLLLNPDAILSSKSLASLLEVMDLDGTLGVCAPLVTEGDGELKTLAAGYEPTVGRMFLHASGLSRLGSYFRFLRGHYLLRGQLSPKKKEWVKWVSGGCMLIRHDAWTDLQGLSERWFMYAEDVDFCLRADDANWGVAIIPWAQAFHSVGASSDDTGGVVRTLWLENLFDLYSLRYGKSLLRRRLWLLTVAGGYGVRAIVMRIKSLRNAAKRSNVHRFATYTRAALKLLRDAH